MASAFALVRWCVWLGFSGLAWSALAGPVSERVPLWFYLQTNLQDTNRFQFATNLLDRAARVGYSGMVLADSKLEMTNSGGPYYNGFLQQFLTYAAKVGITVVPQVYSFGHSETSVVSVDKNLAEPQPVIGATFLVAADGQSLQLDSSFAGVPDGGFERHNGNGFTNWDFQDAIGFRTFAETNPANVHSGICSLRIEPGTNRNARVIKRLAVQPWRQYHVRLWMKTQGFSTGVGQLDAQLNDSAAGTPCNYSGHNGPFTYSTDQDWRQYDYVCNSGRSTNVSLVIGLWNASTGSVWVDDVSVEEIALVNLVRRAGAPVRLYDAVNTNLVYSESIDFNPISDPAIPPTGPFNAWHTPPTVTLPAGTALRPGQHVKLERSRTCPIFKPCPSAYRYPEFGFHWQHRLCLQGAGLDQPDGLAPACNRLEQHEWGIQARGQRRRWAARTILPDRLAVS